MSEEDREIGRSIRFPKRLWDAIDADAKRAKRSAVKQMEAILSVYYGLEDVELDRERLQQIPFTRPPSGLNLTQAYHSDPAAKGARGGTKRDRKGQKDIEDAIRDATEVLRKRKGK